MTQQTLTDRPTCRDASHLKIRSYIQDPEYRIVNLYLWLQQHKLKAAEIFVCVGDSTLHCFSESRQAKMITKPRGPLSTWTAEPHSVPGSQNVTGANKL